MKSNASCRHDAQWMPVWFEGSGVFLWGAADLERFETPSDDRGESFPRAVSFALPMAPHIMAGIRSGPTPAYAEAYGRANEKINTLSRHLAAIIRQRGYRAQPLAASVRSDPAGIRGDFPHKTAAVMAGLGWIGRHCQLITRTFGPWVRLGTVFTDMPMVCGRPATRSYCGSCTRCVDRCPAGALTGRAWSFAMPRAMLLDAGRCDQWKKIHYPQFHNGQNCGICSAVCPYGLKILSSRPCPPNP